MKKNMPLEGLRWSRDSGSALCDTSQNSRSRTGWGGGIKYNLAFYQKTDYPLCLLVCSVVTNSISAEGLFATADNMVAIVTNQGFFIRECI